MSSPRVVIVGAGFGGLACARALRGEPVEVLLLDRNNYHLFTPLLYQVASSLLNPGDIAYPVRAALRRAPNVRFRMAEIRGIDPERRQVRTADGERIPYDWLVLATGSATNYFGNREIDRVSHGLKDLPEALELRNHILLCFETAAAEVDEAERRAWLTFVVVGGGPTGVEYAGALSELVRLVLRRDFPEIDVRRVQIVLVEGMPHLLPTFSPEQREHARAELEARGVRVRLGCRVDGASDREVVLAGGERIAARTFVWSAGVKATEGPVWSGAARSRSGRVRVDSFLRVEGQETVLAVGDLAGVADGDGEIPMLAGPAVQEGRWAAAQIGRAVRGRPLLPFRYHDRGTMATIGRNAAVARLRGISLRGFPGWIAWLFLHLYLLIGFRNRVVVLLGWAWDYVRYDRPVRLITRAGAKHDDPGRSPGSGAVPDDRIRG